MKFKMKTLLFYVFYSENKKKYYLIKSSMIDLEVIHKIIKRRLNLSEKNIIDLDFESNIKEENKIKIYNKFGNLDFLGETYKPLMLKITNTGNDPDYYKVNENGYSEYHLNLIKINSFLASFNKYYANELKNLRKSITITWLFG